MLVLLVKVKVKLESSYIKSGIFLRGKHSFAFTFSILSSFFQENNQRLKVG